MRKRHAVSIAIAAVLGALAVAALPALAGAKDDHGHHRGGDHAGERHDHGGNRGRHPNVGRISAFDASSGQLSIVRFGNRGTVTGLVTSATEIKCEGPDDRLDDSSRRSRDSGSSGSGSSGSGSGDDNSGRGSGDDNGDRGDDRTCTTAALTVGTVVHEFDRELVNGVVSFDEIELGHTR
jgi:hypothetical protein